MVFQKEYYEVERLDYEKKAMGADLKIEIFKLDPQKLNINSRTSLKISIVIIGYPQDCFNDTDTWTKFM